MITVFLPCVALILLLGGFLYERSWYKELSFRVRFSRTHVFAHEVCGLDEIIENRKKMSVPLVEIGFRIPRGLQFEDAGNTLESDYIYKRDLFAMQGLERIERRYHVKAMRRGYYEVSQLSCHAPSRLFHRIYMMDRDAQEDEGGLYVYAANVDCRVLLRTVEVILGETECARRLYEDPFVFSSIRPYTIHDPLKTVNWKATAKTGALMVNTYASSAAVRTRIFLDVSADPGNPFSDSLREYTIAMAASLIRSLVKAHRDVSLVVNCSGGSTAEPSPGAGLAHTDSSQSPGSGSAHASSSQSPGSGSAHASSSQTSGAGLAHTGVSQSPGSGSAHASSSQTSDTGLAHTGVSQSPGSDSAHTNSSQSPGSGFAGTTASQASGAGPADAGCVRFSSCGNIRQMCALEEFLTTDFDLASLIPFEQMLQREAVLCAKPEVSGASSGEVFVLLTSSLRPSLRVRVQELLGAHRSGVLAVICRQADGLHEEREKNLHIVPVIDSSI